VLFLIDVVYPTRNIRNLCITSNRERVDETGRLIAVGRQTGSYPETAIWEVSIRSQSPDSGRVVGNSAVVIHIA
jgi:hypothetical protein